MLNLNKTFFYFTLAIFISMSISCGGGGSDSDSGACNAFRVFNGQQCTNKNIPTVRLEISSSAGTFLCTGTIIGNNSVLTAAHCISSNASVIAMHDNGSQNATRVGVNPLSTLSPAFDTAVVEFPNIASNFGVSPARFNLSNSVDVGENIKVIGYGFDGTDALENGNPRAVELSVAEISNGLIYTLFDDTNSGVCFGDSGGAATLDGKIVGTVSLGGLNCAEGNFNAFSNMQIRGNVEFIEDFVPDVSFE